MERAAALSNLNLLESVSSIPPDIQQCLLTIAQYGCRPDQVQRWYIMVREHFGCEAPPPVGNLYEHEIVVTPLPQSTAPESRTLVAPHSRGSSIASTNKNPHGLGLNLESARPTSRPEYQITPSSDRGGVSVISPVSIASRADSAPELAMVPLNPAMSTPQPTPGTMTFPDCTPNTGTFVFNAPGFAGPTMTPFLGLQGLDVAAMTMSESPTSFAFDASSTGMDFFVPFCSEGPQAGPVTQTAISTGGGSSTPALIPTPPFHQQHHPLINTPEPTPKRRRMASDEFADPANRHQQPAAPFQKGTRAGRAQIASRTPLQPSSRFPQAAVMAAHQLPTPSYPGQHPQPPPPPPPTAMLPTQISGPFPQAPPMTRSPAQPFPLSAGTQASLPQRSPSHVIQPSPRPSSSAATFAPMQPQQHQQNTPQNQQQQQPHFLPMDGPAAYPYHNVHNTNSSSNNNSNNTSRSA